MVQQVLINHCSAHDCLRLARFESAPPSAFQLLRHSSAAAQLDDELRKARKGLRIRK